MTVEDALTALENNRDTAEAVAVVANADLRPHLPRVRRLVFKIEGLVTCWVRAELAVGNHNAVADAISTAMYPQIFLDAVTPRLSPQPSDAPRENQAMVRRLSDALDRGEDISASVAALGHAASRFRDYYDASLLLHELAKRNVDITAAVPDLTAAVDFAATASSEAATRALVRHHLRKHEIALARALVEHPLACVRKAAISAMTDVSLFLRPMTTEEFFGVQNGSYPSYKLSADQWSEDGYFYDPVNERFGSYAIDRKNQLDEVTTLLTADDVRRHCRDDHKAAIHMWLQTVHT